MQAVVFGVPCQGGGPGPLEDGVEAVVGQNRLFEAIAAPLAGARDDEAGHALGQPGDGVLGVVALVREESTRAGDEKVALAGQGESMRG